MIIEHQIRVKLLSDVSMFIKCYDVAQHLRNTYRRLLHSGGCFSLHYTMRHTHLAVVTHVFLCLPQVGVGARMGQVAIL